MNYVILGHIFMLAGMFLAFFAVGIAFFYANLIKGGAAGTAAKLSAIGFVSLALMVFLGFFGVLTGQFDLLNAPKFWPIMGFAVLVTFAILAYAQYIMFRVMK